AAVKSLTRAQARGIFQGTLADWSLLGSAHQPIKVINRRANSGTRAAFGKLVLDGDHFKVGIPEEDSSSTVQNMLLADPSAISYLGFPYRHPQLRFFAVEGVEPTDENVENGSYPLWAFEHLYTRGPASGDVKRF